MSTTCWGLNLTGLSQGLKGGTAVIEYGRARLTHNVAKE